MSLLETLIEGSGSVNTISFWPNKGMYTVNGFSSGETFDRVI